jgi:hypothetical protein
MNQKIEWNNLPWYLKTIIILNLGYIIIWIIAFFIGFFQY